MAKWRIKVPDVRVTEGASDFRIYQQDASGRAEIGLGGTWDKVPEGKKPRVEVRILHQDSGQPIQPRDRMWIEAEATRRNGSWCHRFRGVPAGGLYRIETRLAWTDAGGNEAGQLGDVVHHVGVGDLWLIGGQSNASGTGRGVADDGPQLGVHILGNDERWHLAAHPLNEPAGTDHPNRDAFPGTSPHLRLAKVLSRELGYPVGLVQAARAGSALVEWHIEEDPKAKLWHNMVHQVRLAGGRIRGLAWLQGGHDSCHEQMYRTYEQRFARFVRRARREFGRFGIVLTQSNRWTDVVQPPEVHLGWSIVREAQRRAMKLPDVATVATLNTPLSDGIHNSATGNVILGERMARAALGAVYKRDIVWQAPNVSAARKTRDGKGIELQFDGVAGRLIFIGMGRDEFRVEDAGGQVEVTEAICDGATVLLKLARPLKGRAWAHGAYGIDPAWTLVDYVTNSPALAFYGLKVE